MQPAHDHPFGSLHRDRATDGSPFGAVLSGRSGGLEGLRQRLLVADDDASLRSGVIDLLASLQLEILEADSGPEALAIAIDSRVHAALLDLHMPGRELPGLGGLEVLAALRRGGFSLPCILYSADLTPALEERIRSAGALSILHKPVDPALLRSEIQRALASGNHG